MDGGFTLVLTIIAITINEKWAITKFSGILDLIGYFMANFMLYAFIKAPIILLIGGFTFPVNQDPTLHLISGGISFAALCGFYYWANKRIAANRAAQQTDSLGEET